MTQHRSISVARTCPVKGDVIETVNHRPAAEFDLDKLTRMFMSSGKEYLLTVRRADKTMTVRLKMKRPV